MLSGSLLRNIDNLDLEECNRVNIRELLKYKIRKKKENQLC